MYGLPEEQESFATRGVWQRFMQADEASCTSSNAENNNRVRLRCKSLLLKCHRLFFLVFSCNVNVFQHKERTILHAKTCQKKQPRNAARLSGK